MNTMYSKLGFLFEVLFWRIGSNHGSIDKKLMSKGKFFILLENNSPIYYCSFEYKVFCSYI